MYRRSFVHRFTLPTVRSMFAFILRFCFYTYTCNDITRASAKRERGQRTCSRQTISASDSAVWIQCNRTDPIAFNPIPFSHSDIYRILSTGLHGQIVTFALWPSFAPHPLFFPLPFWFHPSPRPSTFSFSFLHAFDPLPSSLSPTFPLSFVSFSSNFLVSPPFPKLPSICSPLNFFVFNLRRFYLFPYISISLLSTIAIAGVLSLLPLCALSFLSHGHTFVCTCMYESVTRFCQTWICSDQDAKVLRSRFFQLLYIGVNIIVFQYIHVS